MTFVLGRGDGPVDAAPAGKLGRYRAVDGSAGADLYLDVDRPHAALVVGKRGYGKSYTLGVIAEALAEASGVAPVLVDPMGVFRSMTHGEHGIPVEHVDEPRVSPDTLDPRSWCTLLGLSPESGAGALVWGASQDASTLSGMRDAVAATDAPGTDVRAANNHIALAERWAAFDPNGLDAATLASPGLTIVDVAGLDAAPMNAVVRAVAETAFRARIDGDVRRLPWLLLDEAHAFFAGVAGESLERILIRGRAPGVGIVAATQRPGAIPPVAVSQADLVLAHRLTSREDLAALEAARPTYVTGTLDERMPTATGDVLIVDDATETVHAASIRTRRTPHGGDSPRASERSIDRGHQCDEISSIGSNDETGTSGDPIAWE